MARRQLALVILLVAVAVTGTRAAPWGKSFPIGCGTVAVTNAQANSVWMPEAVLWSYPVATTATVAVVRVRQGVTNLLGQVTVSNSCGVIWVSEADYPFECGDVLAVSSTVTNGMVEVIRKAE